MKSPSWPFSAKDFSRYDDSRDGFFYSQPRFVTHIDDGAIKALTSFYDASLPRGSGVAVLDICSSWISHLPKDYRADRIAGLGMNREELSANEALTEFVVQDLNETPVRSNAIVNSAPGRASFTWQIAAPIRKHTLDTWSVFVFTRARSWTLSLQPCRKA